MDLSKIKKVWQRFSMHEVSVQEASGSGGAITPANIQNFTVKAVGNINDSDAGDFKPTEWNLEEIKAAINADSYLRLAVNKYSQLLFKAGYNFVGQKDDAVKYIEARFRLMSFMTGTPMEVIFQQIGEDLVTYSNAFLVKSRLDQNLNGLQAKGVYDPKPVGGYFRIDPTTMQIKRDKNGAIKNYKQVIGNTEKAFKPTDVIHFYVDKAAGTAFGTPRLQAALADVKLLRKIEGSVLELIYRYASPLIQMKIGIPEEGLMATDKEIGEARSEVEKINNDGMIITNERTEFNAIGVEDEALDASKYLEYFEKRVFTAISLSPAMVGRGTAKQDADSMEEQVHDAVKYFQQAIRTFVENFIFTEILLEGGFNPIMDEEDIVHFQFNEISLDTKVKMETHALNKFQGNAISFEEMREALGLRGTEVDESRLFNSMIGNGGGGGSSEPNAEGDGKNKQVSNTMEPENQHGKTTAKIKESAQTLHLKEEINHNSVSLKEDTQADRNKKTEKNEEIYKKKFSKIYKKYNTMRNNVIDESDKTDIILALTKESLEKVLLQYIVIEAQEGYTLACEHAKKIPHESFYIKRSVFEDKVRTHMTELFKQLRIKLESAQTDEEKKEIFDNNSYRLRFLTDKIVAKAKWYAYAQTCAALDIHHIYVDFGQSDDAKEHKRTINTKGFSLDDIPAFHAYCSCKLGIKKAGDK